MPKHRGLRQKIGLKKTAESDIVEVTDMLGKDWILDEQRRSF